MAFWSRSELYSFGGALMRAPTWTGPVPAGTSGADDVEKKLTPFEKARAKIRAMGKAMPAPKMSSSSEVYARPSFTSQSALCTMYSSMKCGQTGAGSSGFQGDEKINLVDPVPPPVKRAREEVDKHNPIALRGHPFRADAPNRKPYTRGS